MCWCITSECAYPHVVCMFPTHLRPGLNKRLNKSMNLKEAGKLENPQHMTALYSLSTLLLISALSAGDQAW